MPDEARMTEVTIAPDVQLTGLKTSQEVNEIGKALAKAQGEFEAVIKSAKNPFFRSKYADLATVIEATRKSLSDNGICVIQSPQGDDDRHVVIITTRLIHASGQWISGDLALPCPKWDAQSIGSAITYARRYSLSAFFCVGAEDDDGNSASEPGPDPDEDAAKDSYNKRTEGQTVIAGFQLDAFNAACSRTNKTKEQIAEYLKGIEPKDMLKSEFNDAIKWASKAITASQGASKPKGKEKGHGGFPVTVEGE